MCGCVSLHNQWQAAFNVEPLKPCPRHDSSFSKNPFAVHQVIKHVFDLCADLRACISIPIQLKETVLGTRSFDCDVLVTLFVIGLAFTKGICGSAAPSVRLPNCRCCIRQAQHRTYTAVWSRSYDVFDLISRPWHVEVSEQLPPITPPYSERTLSRSWTPRSPTKHATGLPLG